MSTARDLKQIAVVNRSHLISVILEIAKGFVVIRNTNKEEYVKEKFWFLTNIYQNSKIHEKSMSESWLTIRSELITLWFPILIMVETI